MKKSTKESSLCSSQETLFSTLTPKPPQQNPKAEHQPHWEMGTPIYARQYHHSHVIESSWHNPYHKYDPIAMEVDHLSPH